MQNNGPKSLDERRQRFAAVTASCIQIWPEKTPAELIAEMLAEGGWVPPEEQSGATEQEPRQVVRSSEWVGEVDAALALMQDLRWSVCDIISEQDWKRYQDAEQHLLKALDSERRPSPTDQALRQGSGGPTK